MCACVYHVSGLSNKEIKSRRGGPTKELKIHYSFVLLLPPLYQMCIFSSHLLLLIIVIAYVYV